MDRQARYLRKGSGKKELYWMYKLKAYAAYDLNKREVYEAFWNEM